MEEAEKLKAKGNALFQACQFEAALETYGDASHLLSQLLRPTTTTTAALADATNTAAIVAVGNGGGGNCDSDILYRHAVLLSNQSNCHFELGQYQTSIVTGRQCLELIDKIITTATAQDQSLSQAQNLQRKNLLRIARAGIYQGLGKDKEDANNDFAKKVLEPLEHLAHCGDAAYEKRATSLLAQIPLLQQHQAKETTTKKLPSIHRASLYGSSICEYYNYGHDTVASALGPGDPANEETDEPSCPAIELDKLPDWDLKNLAIFFGGVGDARHVFTTLCDVHQQWQGLEPEKRSSFRIHTTLNDINPCVLARDILAMAALIRLGTLAPDSHEDCHDPPTESFQLATMLQYTFFSYAMPPCVFDYQMKLIEELLEEDFASLKDVLVIADDQVWSKIKEIMLYWQKAQEGTDLFPTTATVLEHHYAAVRQDSPATAPGTVAYERLQEKRQQNRERKEEFLQEIEDMTIDDFPKEHLDFVRSTMPRSTDESVLLDALKFTLRNVIDETDDDALADAQDGKLSSGRRLDNRFIERVNAILPPAGCAGELYDRILSTDREEGAGLVDLLNQAEHSIKKEWKVNRTMHDPNWTKFREGKMDTNIFNPVADIGTEFLFARGRVLSTFHYEPTIPQLQEMNFFECSTLFFWNVAHALTNLHGAGVLRLELSFGSLTHFCRGIQDDPSRPYPSKFHRMFLSNVPDYIGLLSIFTEVAPLLHRPSKLVPTFIQSNVLYNCGIWRSYSHYVYSATGIPSRSDELRLVGIRNLTLDSVWAHQNQWTWMQDDRPQASREELALWLHRVLLMALLPPARDPHGAWNEQCPTNMATFLRVCTFCVETLGYPRHWVGEIIDDILTARKTGTLKTKAEVPTSSPVVYSGHSKFRNFDLRPFQNEIISQVRLWCTHYSDILIPVTALSIMGNDRCYKYRLNLCKHADSKYLGIPGYGTGGVLMSMVLGFVLSKCDNPDGSGVKASQMYPAKSFLDFCLYDPSMGDGRIRSEALRNGSMAPLIFSCVIFDCSVTDQKHAIEFYMDETTFTEYSNYFISPIRTDSWNQVGARSKKDQLRLCDAVVVEQVIA